ncbi:hypothetical protein WMY93_009231 [Mugilogobius chulae]|uniref:Uncharacterized protein n=1 Tax=Mugilogobius chulae TaxID=88201 RepID=A0AAW0PHG7_9GOBI
MKITHGARAEYSVDLIETGSKPSSALLLLSDQSTSRQLQSASLLLLATVSLFNPRSPNGIQTDTGMVQLIRRKTCHNLWEIAASVSTNGQRCKITIHCARAFHPFPPPLSSLPSEYQADRSQRHPPRLVGQHIYPVKSKRGQTSESKSSREVP